MASDRMKKISSDTESSPSGSANRGSEDDSDSSDSESGGPVFHRRVSTNKTLKNSVILKEGWLLKKSAPFQKWHRRYFKLQAKKLYYAKDKDSPIFDEVSLVDLSLAESGVKNANNVFQLISPQQRNNIILCAETRREMEEWIGVLKAAASREYYDVSEQINLFSGQHNWYVCSHARPTYCNICKEVLSGVASRGLSCEVCKFKSHKRCAVRAPNNCKWTTLASMGKANIIEDPDGSIFMKHQWMEGNLHVSAKCSLCDRTCGSVLRLLDYRCLWCKATVHSACLETFPERCPLLPACRFSTVPPTLFNHNENDSMAVCLSEPHSHAWRSNSTASSSSHQRRYSHIGLSPLLVFANSKSGDNQGVKFLRRFKQTLNPAQVFDLMHSGTALGLKLFKNFDSFRVLVCGGDGSVGWVLQDLDAQNLLRKCQVAILPLGTGNDLARVLGWGSTCDADVPLATVLEKYEWASSKLLDRWSIMEYHEGSPAVPLLPSPSMPRNTAIAAYENSVASHLSRIMLSEEQCELLNSSRVLCETIKDFVANVGAAFAGEPDQQGMILKCQILNEKLDRLMDTLRRESIEASKSAFVVVGAPSHEPSSASSSSSATTEGWASSATELAPSKSGNTAGPSALSLSTATIRKRALVQQDVILSRANSLKKAVRQIIEHTEHAVDEQNSLQVPRPLGRRQSRSVEEIMIHRTVQPDSLPGPTEKDLDLDQPHVTKEFLKKSPLDLAAGAASLMPPQADLMRSRSESTGGTHPWIKSPPLHSYVPHIKRGLVTNLAAGTSLITRVLLASADALGNTGTGSRSHMLPLGREDIALEAFRERCVMNNYFGVGLDAKIALEFHQKREEHPEKCRSRTKNMMWYGVLGVKELQKRTYQHLEQRVQLECDGQRIPLPSLQGIVVLNISSYMGGANFWGGSKSDDFFRAPAFDDRMLEVVAVFGTMQMAVSKVVRIQHHRIAQCRSVRIFIKGDEGIPVQVDGEAWLQPPGCIHIVHKNRAQMLCRDRHFENVFKMWQQQQHRNLVCQGRSLGDQKVPAILTEKETELLDRFARSSARLIRCVKVATLGCPEMECEIAPIVNKASETLDHLCPYGRVVNIEVESVPNVKFIASRLISAIRELREEAADLLKAKPKSLVLSAEIAEEIQSAINDVDARLQQIAEGGLPVPVLREDESKESSSESAKTFKGRLLGRFRRHRVPDSEPTFRYPNLSVDEWTSDDVALWLSSIGLGEYKEVFVSHDIRGSELLHLERRDLKDLGITKVGHLKRLQQAIRDLVLRIGDSSVA